MRSSNVSIFTVIEQKAMYAFCGDAILFTDILQKYFHDKSGAIIALTSEVRSL
jgi:hypothetical protein